MPRCPVCEGHTIEIRGKCVCPFCHIIVETCCEGGRCEYAREQEQEASNNKTESQS